MAKELTLPPGECPIANFVGNLIFSLLSGRQSGLPDCAPTPNFQTSSEGCHSRKLLLWEALGRARKHESAGAILGRRTCPSTGTASAMRSRVCGTTPPTGSGNMNTGYWAESRSDSVDRSKRILLILRKLRH
jgi:hypothetical protein